MQLTIYTEVTRGLHGLNRYDPFNDLYDKIVINVIEIKHLWDQMF